MQMSYCKVVVVVVVFFCGILQMHQVLSKQFQPGPACSGHVLLRFKSSWQTKPGRMSGLSTAYVLSP